MRLGGAGVVGPVMVFASATDLGWRRFSPLVITVVKPSFSSKLRLWLAAPACVAAESDSCSTPSIGGVSSICGGLEGPGSGGGGSGASGRGGFPFSLSVIFPCVG